MDIIPLLPIFFPSSTSILTFLRAMDHLFEVNIIWLDELDLPTLEKPLNRLTGKFIGSVMLQHKASPNGLVRRLLCLTL